MIILSASPNTMAYIRTAEHNAKIGLANKGKVRTPEMRAHMSAVKKGTVLSAAHRQAIKYAAANKPKRVWTPEERERMYRVHKGAVRSPEARAKMSEARKRYLMRKKLEDAG